MLQCHPNWIFHSDPHRANDVKRDEEIVHVPGWRIRRLHIENAAKKRQASMFRLHDSRVKIRIANETNIEQRSTDDDANDINYHLSRFSIIQMIIFHFVSIWTGGWMIKWEIACVQMFVFRFERRIDASHSTSGDMRCTSHNFIWNVSTSIRIMRHQT